MTETPKRRGRPPGRSQGRQYEQTTVHLPPDLITRLDAHWPGSGHSSRSELIRAFCEEGLRRAAKRAGKDGNNA